MIGDGESFNQSWGFAELLYYGRSKLRMRWRQATPGGSIARLNNDDILTASTFPLISRTSIHSFLHEDIY